MSSSFALRLDLAVEVDGDGFVGVLDLKRGAVGFPAVGLLALKAVEDFLAKEAVLVVDAVAEAGHAERRHGFQHASGETAQAAVSQAGIGFAVQYIVEADSESRQHLAAEFVGAQVRKIVGQRAPHQEFHREVVQALLVLVTIPPLRLHQAVNDAVANCQGNRGQVIGRGQLRRRANQGVTNVAKYGFPQHFRRTPLGKKLFSGHIMRALSTY